MLKRLLFVLALVYAFGSLAAALVDEGIYVIPGMTRPEAQPDGNSVLLETPRGFIVFDTGRHAAHTRQIIEFAERASRPVVAIINSHWHLDHIGGNAMLRARYPEARVYASAALDDALTGFLANYRKQLESAVAQAGKDPAAQESMRTEIALIDAGSKLGPTDVIAASGPRSIAGRTLDMHLEHSAVTAGDLWVLDEKTGVLLAGDLVTLPAPFLDTACPERWREALDRLAHANFKVLVPGHGASMDPSGLETYRAAFRQLLACAAGTQPKAACVDGWLRDADPLIPDGDRAYARGLIDYYMDQVLRGNSDKMRRLCAS